MSGQLLGGVVLLGSAEVALKRVLSSFTVYDAEVVDSHWAFVHAISTPENFTSQKRIWWRYPRSQNLPPAFISLNPGEHRTDTPDGPDDVILDPPEPDQAATLSSILEALLREVQKPWIPQTDQLKHLQLSAENALSEARKPSYKAAVELFNEASQKVQFDQNADSKEIVKHLYHQCLLTHQFPICRFSPALLLWQLQGMLNQWITPSPYEEPVSYFYGYVDQIKETSHAAQMCKHLVYIGNIAYDEATAYLKDALNASSLMKLNYFLILALHSYTTATIVAAADKKSSLGLSFKYKSLLAEEGFSCTLDGMMSGVRFFLQDPDDIAKRIHSEIASGRDIQSIKRETSSPIFPVLTKFFWRSLLARAMTLSPGASFTAGLSELQALEKEYMSHNDAFDTSSLFEIAWLEHCLLSAYKVAGNDMLVKEYANKIAGRLVIATVLHQ